MPAEFTNVTEQEMADFLGPQGFKKVAIPGTYELVWGKRVDQDDLNLTLRVFSGINPDGQSREVGEDAMRVRLFMRTADGQIKELGGSKRVHRVKNWRKNLQSRLDSWLEYMPKDKCNQCGSPMVPRKGRFGAFIACTNCKNTRSVT